MIFSSVAFLVEEGEWVLVRELGSEGPSRGRCGRVLTHLMEEEGNGGQYAVSCSSSVSP